MQDLLAGRIDYVCTSVSTALPEIGAKKVKAIAALTRGRSPIVPALPTADEQGVTGFDASVWYGLMLPKEIPKVPLDDFVEATLLMMSTRSVVEHLKENGATLVAPERRLPAYMQTFVEREIEKWGAAVKAAGLTPN
jgi:tripartite-type tricarboxylate transporter receptor subunit TctC